MSDADDSVKTTDNPTEKTEKPSEDVPKIFPHWCAHPLQLWTVLQTMSMVQLATTYARITEGELIFLCLIQGLQVRVGDEWLVGTSLSRGCFNKYQQILKRYAVTLQKAKAELTGQTTMDGVEGKAEDTVNRKRKLDGPSTASENPAADKSAGGKSKGQEKNGKNASQSTGRPPLVDELVDCYGDHAFAFPDITLQLSHLPKWVLAFDHMQQSGINDYCTLRQFAHYYRFVGVSTIVNQALCAMMDGAAIARPVLFTPQDSLTEITGIVSILNESVNNLIIKEEIKQEIDTILSDLCVVNPTISHEQAQTALSEHYTQRALIPPEAVDTQLKCSSELSLPLNLAQQWFFSYLLPSVSPSTVSYPAIPVKIPLPTEDSMSLCGIQFESPMVGLEGLGSTGLRKVRLCLSKNTIARRHILSGPWLSDADSAASITGSLKTPFSYAITDYLTGLKTDPHSTAASERVCAVEKTYAAGKVVADPDVVSKYYRRPSDDALKSWNITTGGVLTGEEPSRDWFNILLNDICRANKAFRYAPFFSAQVLFARMCQRVIAVVRGEEPVPAAHPSYLALRKEFCNNSWVQTTACVYEQDCVVDDNDLVMVFRDLIDTEHVSRKSQGIVRGSDGNLDLDVLESQLECLFARQMHTYTLEVITAACHSVKILKTSLLAAIMRYRGMHREETLEDDVLATTLLARITDLFFRCAFTQVPEGLVLTAPATKDKKEDSFILAIYKYASVLSQAEAEARACDHTVARYGMLSVINCEDTMLLHDPSGNMPMLTYLPGIPNK